MKRFDQQVAVITGGSHGLGRAIAYAFASEGAKVVIADLNEEIGRQTVEQIIRNGGEALFVRTDVSREEDVKAMVEQTVKVYGQLDLAINNAGITQQVIPVAEQTAALFDRIMNINVKGIWLGMKYEILEMLKRKRGAIVNISSVVDTTAEAGMAFYVASKHAITGLTKSAALEYIGQGIRINALSPASIRTEMVEEFGRLNPEVMKKIEAAHPIGRIAEPEEIARVALFLCSDDASFVVGHSLKADGGYTIQ